MAAALMGKAAYARYRDVGKSAVSNWIKRGQIVLVDGKVDVGASDALLGSIVDPGLGRDAKGAGPTFAAEKPERKPSSGRVAKADTPGASNATAANSAAQQLAEELLR